MERWLADVSEFGWEIEVTSAKPFLPGNATPGNRGLNLNESLSFIQQLSAQQQRKAE